jgi:outer membrane protein assembly factor BamB
MAHRFFIVFVNLALSASSVAGDWPQFLGPARNGSSPETKLIDSLPTDKPRPKWRVEIGGGYSSPVVVGGQVLQFHWKDGQETLEAFAISMGQSIWKVGYPCEYAGGMFREQGPRATPTVVGDDVLTFGSDGVLQCVSLKKGEVRWRRALQKEFEVPDSFFGVASSPLVVDGLALVNLGARNGAGICAFRLTDGSLAWKATDDEASYSSPVLATLDGKPTALFFARSGLHAIDLATGKERFFFRWRARMDASVNAATPLVWNDQVFLTTSYGVGAVLLDCRGDEPKVVWKSADGLAAHFNTPVKVGEHLYGIDGRQEGGARLVCVEAQTGKLCWDVPDFGCATIIAAEGKLFLLRESGELVLCRASPESFQRLGGTILTSKLCRAAPALADGKLYIRSESELICLDVRKKL